MKGLSWFTGVLLCVVTSAALQPIALAQEEEGDDLGWSDAAEFSFVLTAGNSETQTLGFNNTLQRKWERALFKLKAGALRAENTSDLGFAIGTPGDFSIPEITTTTAENYYLGGRYDRNITERFFWYAGASWLRNEFAGIQNRYLASGGVGNIWYDRDRFLFRTNYGVSYTDQQDVVEIPGVDRSFAGILLGWNIKKKLGKTSEYGNDLIFNYNVEESSDWRWVMDQWFAVALSEKLALKVSLQWLYNNLPAFREFELRPDIDSPAAGTVLVELDKLDTLFSTSLVVNF